ncbi:MAG: PD-(D/E)XK nuclease family protein, partial [Clostridia bacterium]|nr:PD-(D/E)XK nuclease family protein [Clostridia bacterium]
SIYGFQGSEPSLFADYRKNDEVKKVYLRHNFRSEKPVIDFANKICGTLFRYAGLTVPYDETDELVCGKGGTGSYDTELTVVGTAEGNAEVRRSAEADYVASRIETLLREGTRPSDICILLRSTSRASVDYEEALSRRGIPCRNRITKDLFMNPEVLMVLNLLHVIDNPTRDIYLAGALKSPVYNVTVSELTRIRRHRKDGSLYDALTAYVADTGFAKGRYFLEKLAEYRAMVSEPVDKLIWHLYNDAEIFALATGKREDVASSDRRANLILLYDYARKFESGSFKGLYNFIRYISDVLDSGAGFSSAPPSAATENVVRIMSIHQSKGLEFPVVFLCDCGADFNKSDTTKRVLIDRHYGTTLKLPDSTGLASIDTVFRKAESLGIAMKGYDEEIRVLYVALTRPINRLIVTGSSAKPEELLTKCCLLSEMVAPNTAYLFHKNAGYLPWLLIAAGSDYRPTVYMAKDNETDSEALSFDAEEPNAQPDENRIRQLTADYRESFAYTYPNSAVAALPAKLSVSELYPSILDEYDDAVKMSDLREKRLKTPRFLQSTRDSAADRGTATHQFMQFCDFKALSTTSVEDELSRLVNWGFLDTHTASLVDQKMLSAFLKSDLYPELRAAEDLRRELRFNVRLPAEAFTEEPTTKEELKGETVLVQGIMDGLFTDAAGRLTVLDYKTDRIPSDMAGDPAAFGELLIRRHRRQLSYYRAACETVACRPVERILLYSFALGRTVNVPLSALIVL